MYYVIQENLFKEYHFNTLIDHLKRYGLEYELVEYRPFVDNVQVKTDRKDVWFFGSVNAAMKLGHKDWYPGIMYNEDHDFEKYLLKYRENMLNSEAKVLEFGHLLGKEETNANRWGVFIRPSRDTKIFESRVYTGQEWNSYIDETINSGSYLDISKETKMVVSNPKPDIQQEIRCWIVDGEPVTMSQYKIGKRVNMLNMDHNEESYIFAKNMAKVFSPSRAYVMDVCLYNDDYKIVEINCINMSGFYDGNMSKLIQSLENTFS